MYVCIFMNILCSRRYGLINEGFISIHVRMSTSVLEDELTIIKYMPAHHCLMHDDSAIVEWNQAQLRFPHTKETV